jgi:TadE-like protein
VGEVARPARQSGAADSAKRLRRGRSRPLPSARPPDRRGVGEAGAALVEFALVLPLLASLALGTLTGGIAFGVKQDITAAARVGARTSTCSAPPTSSRSTSSRRRPEPAGLRQLRGADPLPRRANEALVSAPFPSADGLVVASASDRTRQPQPYSAPRAPQRCVGTGW